MDKQVVPKTMIALEVFVKGKFMTFREFLVYFYRAPLFAVLPRFATANHKGWIRTCWETSYSFSGKTSSKTILGSCYWKKQIDVSFYASVLSLLMMNCVITVFFNLSRTIVALQVETYCCAYYYFCDQLVLQQNSVASWGITLPKWTRVLLSATNCINQGTDS